jgi:hypothetical protein
MQKRRIRITFTPARRSTTGGTTMSSTARDAIEAARAYLADHRDAIPGYRGAFIAGSVAQLEHDAPVPPGSDVDVMIVADEAGALGKTFADGNLVIEGTLLDAATVLDPDAVLRDYHLAPGIAHARIIDDPDGDIARVQAAVQARYADPDTIRARLNHVESRARATLASALPAATEDRPEPDRVNAWLFGTGQLAHLVLVAALENPTIRTRYVRAGEVLARHGEDVASERLLRLARVNRLRRPAVEALARELDGLLVATGPVADNSGWRFASDIATPMRPLVMDGIRAMIHDGRHREAMFPLAMTWLRCVQLLAHEDAPTIPSLAPLRDALRIPTDDALHAAVAESTATIPEIRALAERILR